MQYAIVSLHYSSYTYHFCSAALYQFPAYEHEHGIIMINIAFTISCNQHIGIVQERKLFSYCDSRYESCLSNLV